ncbi:dTDP-4-dehydrorhamnose reductase [Prevotella sp. S7-1-8]|uniref:dTDP-4-dehydrorhamnose reductase n=1 Tax=Prevotella sp. S7-1-8 TaxID=1284775 RepID=UPI00050F64A7|nr:dTDP-4-dehydrorhamnose reductase [Prevotella sp. S7-1-8]KGF19229.1 dTDP-4-dehydrorhamnose reductase [Prevotella sp. S7-1-8]
MNILVTGANGQLGREMQAVTRESKDHYIFTDVCEGYTHLDITSADDIRQMVRQNQVKCVINCAAWTNVDAAETAGDIVERLNATAPGYLAEAMAEVGGLLVHVSTDYVFGAEPYNTPCREDQQGTPTGVYGQTKLRGEQLIKRSGADHVIIRTAWLYSEFGHNFVKTMMSLTASKPQLNVVFDQCGTPTYALDLAAAIFDIVENRKYVGHSGVYHYSNEGVCSWYDFAVNIARLAGNTDCDIRPCHSDEFPSPVRRPAYSVLDKTKIKRVFGLDIPYWTDSLRQCMRRMKG